MTREELMQDVAYARTLAEEGRHAPLLGGSYYVFWGLMHALAFAAQWAILTGRAPDLDGAAFALLWTGYGVIAAIGTTILRLRDRGKPGWTSIGNRAERAVWGGAVLGLMAVVVGSLARMVIDQDWTAPNAIFGAAFALYGAALLAIAHVSEQSWMRAFGWLSVVAAGTLCLFANQPWAYLIASAGSVLVLFIPGVILLRREPSAIV